MRLSFRYNRGSYKLQTWRKYSRPSRMRLTPFFDTKFKDQGHTGPVDFGIGVWQCIIDMKLVCAVALADLNRTAPANVLYSGRRFKNSSGSCDHEFWPFWQKYGDISCTREEAYFHRTWSFYGLRFQTYRPERGRRDGQTAPFRNAAPCREGDI